jgi:uncharacterized protein
VEKQLRTALKLAIASIYRQKFALVGKLMDKDLPSDLPQYAKTCISEFRHRAVVVREIQSGLAQSKRRWDISHTILVVVLGAAITFLGFMGPDRILDSWPSVVASPATPSGTTTVSAVSVAPPPPVNAAPAAAASVSLTNNSTKKTFDLLFNICTLGLFITSLLNLIYRWKEEHSAHFQGVVKLTQYLHWLDELELNATGSFSPHTLREIRLKYQVIAEQLLPNSNSDYLAAKKRLLKKKVNGSQGSRVSSASLNGGIGLSESLVIQAVSTSPVHQNLLAIAHEIRPDMWLGGGAVRNLVWDALTGNSTKFEDFDLVYFDETSLGAGPDKDLEECLQTQLKERMPDPVNISVRNQARMHLDTSEPKRTSLQDAVENWPETATCVAVRVNDVGAIEVMAPHGLSDLMNMIVKPTPYHRAHPKAFEARKKTKHWQEIWPELRYEQ